MAKYAVFLLILCPLALSADGIYETGRHQPGLPEKPDLADSLYQQAHQFFVEGDYDSARTRLDQLRAVEGESHRWEDLNQRSAQFQAWENKVDQVAEENTRFYPESQAAHEHRTKGPKLWQQWTKDPVKVPKGWQEKMAAREKRSQDRQAQVFDHSKPNWQKDAEAKLAEKVSVEFEEVPFSEVLDYLRQMTGVNVMVDRRVKDIKDQKVSFQAEDMTLSTVVSWIAENELGVGTRFKQEALVFVPLDENRPVGTITRMYDLSELMALQNLQDHQPEFQMGIPEARGRAFGLQDRDHPLGNDDMIAQRDRARQDRGPVALEDIVVLLENTLGEDLEVGVEVEEGLVLPLPK